MNRNEWIRINNDDHYVPSSKKKVRKGGFDPDQDFIDEATAKFLEKGGKITMVENQFIEW